MFAVLANEHGCYCINSTTDANIISDRISNTALVDIFQKYGTNGTLNFEAFEHLLHSLGLGNIAHMDHGLHEHRKNGSSHFDNLHTDHQHSEVETEDHFHGHDDVEENHDVQHSTAKKVIY